jgi:hypothetical protein
MRLVRQAPVTGGRQVGHQVAQPGQPGLLRRALDDVHVDHDRDRHLRPDRVLPAVVAEDDPDRRTDGVTGQLGRYRHDLRVAAGGGQLPDVDDPPAADPDHVVGPYGVDRRDRQSDRCLGVVGDDAGRDRVATSLGVLRDRPAVAGRRAWPAVDDQQAAGAVDQLVERMHHRIRPANQSHQTRDPDRSVGRGRDRHRAWPSRPAATPSARW